MDTRVAFGWMHETSDHASCERLLASKLQNCATCGELREEGEVGCDWMNGTSDHDMHDMQGCLQASYKGVPLAGNSWKKR